eukprot:GCRY01002560.1.p1 GENE.GCRY01002560.1~~GCRY01002560.1.p1  ORF type:complete len:913 (+),score=244.35 GCRY01002560.1:105-2843(+)
MGRERQEKGCFRSCSTFSFVNGWIKLHHKYCILGFLFWWCLLICGIVFTKTFFNTTFYEIGFPKGSEGESAFLKTKEKFGLVADSSALVLVYSISINDTFSNKSSAFRFDETVFSFCHNYTTNNFIVDYQGYFRYKEQNLGFLADQYIREDKTAESQIAITAIFYDELDLREASRFYRQLTALIDREKEELTASNVDLEVTGLPALLKEAQDSTALLTVFLAVTGAALLLILYVALGSSLLLLCVILAVITSLFSSFFICLALALNTSIAPFVPAVMGAATIALSFSQSLLLFRQYALITLPAWQNACPLLQVKIAFFHSLKYTVASALLLVVPFAGMALLPMTMISTMGLALVLSIVITTLCSLSFSPMLLIVCERWSSRGMADETKPLLVNTVVDSPAQNPHKPPTSSPKATLSPTLSDQITTSPLLFAPPSPTSPLCFVQSKDSGSFIYAKQPISPLNLKLAQWIVKGDWLLSVLMLGLCAFACVYLVKIHPSIEIRQMLETSSPSVRALEHLEQSFGAGIVSPYQLLIESDTPGALDMDIHSMKARDFFNYTCQSMKMLIHSSHGQISTNGSISVTGLLPSLDGSYELCWYYPLAVTLLSPQFENNTFARAYSHLFSSLVSPDKSSTLVLIVSESDPFGFQASAFIDTVRSAVASLPSNTSSSLNTYHAYLNGGSVGFKDSVDAVYARTPLILGVVGLLLLLLLLFFLHSLLLTVCTLFGTAITLVSALGLSQWVYGLPLQGWDNIALAHGQLNWIVPIVALPVGIGLGSFYVLFVCSEVHTDLLVTASSSTPSATIGSTDLDPNADPDDRNLEALPDPEATDQDVSRPKPAHIIAAQLAPILPFTSSGAAVLSLPFLCIFFFGAQCCMTQVGLIMFFAAFLSAFFVGPVLASLSSRVTIALARRHDA